MDCAAGTAPCVLHVLAVQADYDLQSAYQATLGDQTAFADFLCFIIRKLRLAYVVSFCFTNAEYRIALVDFIVALRRTKGWRRRTLRSPSPPSSGLHLLTPGGLRCGGAYLLTRAWGNVGIRYPVQIAHPHFDVVFGCFVFGLGLFAFQKISLGFGLSFFIGGGIDCSFLRLREVLLFLS